MNREEEELAEKYDNLFSLIWGIVKALFLFVFRLFLLIPMLFLGIIGAVLGASDRSICEAIWTIILHPFKALIEAIQNISYAIQVYRNNQ